MSNPSTVWAQLSLPLSPVGSIPFVNIDGQTIDTDVGNFQYLSGNYGNYAGYQLPYQLFVRNSIAVAYTDTTGLPPSTTYTINKPSGRVTIPQGESSIIVTCNCCFASSIILLSMVGPFDSDLTRIISVPSAGSFTITGNAAADTALVVDFLIINRSAN